VGHTRRAGDGRQALAAASKFEYVKQNTMSGYPSYRDYEPYGYIRRIPVYNSTILAVLLVVGVILTAIGDASHLPVYLFEYDAATFWQKAHVWTVVTYSFVEKPRFFFLFGVFLLFNFGTEVERYLGKKRFLLLIGLLFLVPTLVFSLWWKVGWPGDFYLKGPENLLVGIFVAFATFYPNVEYWGWVTMKWLAFAGIFLAAMSYLPSNDWAGLTSILVSCGTGFGYVRWRQQGSQLPSWVDIKRLFRPKPKFRVLPKPESTVEAQFTLQDEDEAVDSINPLLDKIAKSGIESLTAAEKAKLEKTARNLQKKDK